MLSVPSQHLERLDNRSSWLCRDDADRERMIDMEDRVRPYRQYAFAILAVAIASVGPWVGWWPLLFLIPALAFFATASQLLSRVARPELVMFAAWIGSELAIAGAISLEGGARVAALSWLAIPVITLSSRFSLRGIIAGVTIASALVLAVGFGIDTSLVVHSPALVIAPLALILCVAVLSTPLMHSDIQHRSDAVIDQLTGMLNRKALGARSHELAQQSQVTGEPVGLIVADVDHFKRVNDTRGHDAGDIVLKEVAYVLRKQLRAFDLAYRLGGEEFLILVPGSDLEHTIELAERLRAAIAANLISGGLSVTMSLGVAGSARDERFDYAAVFAKADAALYRAKHGGRNRVCAAEHGEDDDADRAVQADGLRPAGEAPALA
ncbi:MAG TPA: diguanylate cyclase [Solirubrobacteraceae bacterium]|nr:diguanylate cyclase [Solirubrobacteraceae bacterium]